MAAGAVALPTTTGPTNFGAFGSSVWSISVTVKPLADGIERGTVAVTADDEPVEPVHPVLQASQGGVLRSAGAREGAARRAQHPAQLAQGPWLVVDPAQDQRRDRHVEGVILEREVLGRGAQHRRGRALVMDPPLQAPQHRRRLGSVIVRT